MKQNTFDDCSSFTEMLEKLEYNYAHRKWYVKVWHSIYRFFKHITVDAYWKYLRNWNWRAPNPRGFTSRHGYADTVELIPGQMFALFMRYYEAEYQTQAYLYTQDDLNKKLSDPGSFIESAELIQRHLVFQKRVEWVANWVRTVYDTWDDQPDWTLEKEEVYCRDLRKAMHIIVKYHGWMWT